MKFFTNEVKLIKENKVRDSYTRILGYAEDLVVLEGHYNKPCILPMHSHKQSQFTTIVSGSMIMRDDKGNEKTIYPGESVYWEPYEMHESEVVEPTVMIEISTPVKLNLVEMHEKIVSEK